MIGASAGPWTWSCSPTGGVSCWEASSELTIGSLIHGPSPNFGDGPFSYRLPAHIQSVAHRKLLLIDAAASLCDLFAPPGNRLEALQGERSGQWCIRVNDQWRICFYFVDGEALNVQIVDYH